MESEKRKEYMRSIYSKDWSRKRRKYGVEQYDKDLIHQLSKKIKDGKILEVGIGDGFPYSNILDEMGYEVYGIDISPTHVDMVKESLPKINVKIGDSEDLEFNDNFFDIVFCFRSTWYFPDVIKSISEMLRVVKNDGLVIFDIQNINHPIHQKMVKKSNRRQKKHPFINIVEKYIKNIIKIALRPIVFYGVDWSFQNYSFIETPTDPNDVIAYLQSRKDVGYKLYGVEWNHSFTLKEINETANLNQFDRLVYKISK
tara:strand:- start:275 stop:1042 length:768 start_codon:yes stop_codon:yes gene_type:complete